MKIVSNTGPIIGLAKVDQLFLLKNVASEVLIPPNWKSQTSLQKHLSSLLWFTSQCIIR